MQRGFIALWRKIQDSDMYRDFNSEYRDVMIQLLLMANHEKRQFELNREIITLERGQVYTSLNLIKNHCAKNVSVFQIRTAIEKLERWGFLKNDSTGNGRIVTILNYDTYQSPKSKKPSHAQANHNKQELNKDIYNKQFEEIWKLYPRKKGKKDAKRYFNASIKSDKDNEDIRIALNNYLADIERNKTPEKYIQHGSKWFNNWYDWLETNSDKTDQTSIIPESTLKTIKKKLDKTTKPEEVLCIKQKWIAYPDEVKKIAIKKHGKKFWQQVIDLETETTN